MSLRLRQRTAPPPPRWLALGPGLTALAMALDLLDGEPAGPGRWFSVGLLVACLALVLAILAWPRRP